MVGSVRAQGREIGEGRVGELRACDTGPVGTQQARAGARAGQVGKSRRIQCRY